MVRLALSSTRARRSRGAGRATHPGARLWIRFQVAGSFSLPLPAPPCAAIPSSRRVRGHDSHFVLCQAGSRDAKGKKARSRVLSCLVRQATAQTAISFCFSSLASPKKKKKLFGLFSGEKNSL